MKVLFIGGTGIISTSSSQLAVARAWTCTCSIAARGKVTLSRPAKVILGDIPSRPRPRRPLLDTNGTPWWIGLPLAPPTSSGDIRLCLQDAAGHLHQLGERLSEAAVQPVVTESTPLCNPFWDYSRNKIAREECLMWAYRESGFPMTVVRPSLTFNDTNIPLAIGCWTDYTMIDRMKKGKPVIVHGDGSGVWTITHADDFARAWWACWATRRQSARRSTSRRTSCSTWERIYQIVAEAAGARRTSSTSPRTSSPVDEFQRGNLLGDKAASLIFDNSKIKRFAPEFHATIPFHAGIRRTLAWFEASRPHEDYPRATTSSWTA